MKKTMGFFCCVITIVMTVCSLKRSFVDTGSTNSSESITNDTYSKASEHNTKGSEKKEEISWNKPSEQKQYPKLSSTDILLVDTQKQRVYVKRNEKILYTMYCSTGSEKTPTPKGSFLIEPERGDHFFNNETGEGANYYVSFSGHGIYLFHTIPVDNNGQYKKSEGEKLGKSANSHGCVRLSVPDAKWLYRNAIVGMRVEIK
ncbi:MAG: L,D-transpeptidase [Enterococcus avium]